MPRTFFSTKLLKENPHLSIEDLIPTAKQLSRSLNKSYKECFSQTVMPLISIANENGFAVSADFARHNASYLAITLHFIDNEKYIL
jgi:hypothetical protein